MNLTVNSLYEIPFEDYEKTNIFHPSPTENCAESTKFATKTSETIKFGQFWSNIDQNLENLHPKSSMQQNVVVV